MFSHVGVGFKSMVGREIKSMTKLTFKLGYDRSFLVIFNHFSISDKISKHV
jgi:hypothetical protein